ncbi:fimbrial protein [Cronobacter condimenti 1330]|uniref:Fimbrial protein n=1 Tax=Cronobacter condimenti 1330 TaxID=1073999 RepID=A0ABM5V9M1_9ENTR|nr:fimbrial protein [Cronobacter condimenti]ALB61695.1 fimbrial protein [Cronobacter condimenti 1330]
MKKVAGMLILSSLFISQAWAQVSVNDTAAQLHLMGTLKSGDETSCAVGLSQSTINFNTSTDDIKEQNKINTGGIQLMLSVSNTDYCRYQIENNHIVFKFTGQKDNASGTVLANNSTSEGAAKGVGVATYNNAGIPVDINTGTLKATLPLTPFKLDIVKLKDQDVVPGDYQGTMTIEIQRL